MVLKTSLGTSIMKHLFPDCRQLPCVQVNRTAGPGLINVPLLSASSWTGHNASAREQGSYPGDSKVLVGELSPRGRCKHMLRRCGQRMHISHNNLHMLHIHMQTCRPQYLCMRAQIRRREHMRRRAHGLEHVHGCACAHDAYSDKHRSDMNWFHKFVSWYFKICKNRGQGSYLIYIYIYIYTYICDYIDLLAKCPSCLHPGRPWGRWKPCCLGRPGDATLLLLWLVLLLLLRIIFFLIMIINTTVTIAIATCISICTIESPAVWGCSEGTSTKCTRAKGHLYAYPKTS